MPRLFTGIEIPPDICDDLAGLTQPLPGTRWINPDNFHITLRFAGDIDGAAAREFSAALRSIEFDPFHLRLDGLGTFGGNDPRTLWAGVSTSEPLLALARANELAARNAGLPVERRKFAPHVTLARLQAPRVEALARFMQRRGGFASPEFLVDHFVLYSSKPNTGGGPYVIEESFPSTLGEIDEADWDFEQPSKFY